MSFYPRSGSEEEHNKVLQMDQCPSLTHAAEALDPNFKGGFLIKADFDPRNPDDELFDWVGDSVGGTTDGYTPPSKEDIKAKLAELISEYDNIAYQRHRAVEYPHLSDQLDMIYHDQLDGTTAWKDAIISIKNAFPKPN